MTTMNIMQQALGEQWSQLPTVLRAHYQTADNHDVGTLDIEYPRAMQLVLNVLHLFGALLNRRGKGFATTVSKRMHDDSQRWQRTVRLPNGKCVLFNSRWVYAGGNRLIEYVNSLLGLCMAVRVEEGKLCYSGQYYVVRLGRWQLRLPEWLLLGHTTIVEHAVDATQFAMDFRLLHPWFGQIYRYAGTFTTVAQVANESNSAATIIAR